MVLQASILLRYLRDWHSVIVRSEGDTESASGSGGVSLNQLPTFLKPGNISYSISEARQNIRTNESLKTAEREIEEVSPNRQPERRNQSLQRETLAACRVAGI